MKIPRPYSPWPGSVSEALVLSPFTEKTYVSRLITKLGVRDRAQLIITAYENGVVNLGDY